MVKTPCCKGILFFGLSRVLIEGLLGFIEGGLTMAHVSRPASMAQSARQSEAGGMEMLRQRLPPSNANAEESFQMSCGAQTLCVKPSSP